MGPSSKNCWPNIIIYGAKNGFPILLPVNQQELERWCQVKNREIDIKSAAQMVPWLLPSVLWGRQFPH